MTWLAVAGALFLIWFVLVFLFTPGIGYHLRARVPLDSPGFVHTSREITLEAWQRRPWWEKLLEPVSWILERQQ